MTVCRASVRLCQPAASGRSVDCIEVAVRRLYDREDVFGVASCCYLLVQLDLLCGRPATIARVAAHGLAALSPDLAMCMRQQSAPMWSPMVSWFVTPRVVAALLM
jgi:transcriptional regulator GlxA family with amidase domain